MHPTSDAVANAVAPDEATRQGAVVLFGYVGATSSEGVSRLYREDFQSWYEVKDGDVVHQLPGADPGGRSYLWVKRDADIVHSTAKPASEFAKDEAEAVDPGGTYYPRR